MRSKSLIWIASAALVVLFLVGCAGLAPTPTTVPTPAATATLSSASMSAAEASWSFYTNKSEGMAIGLPPGWKRLELDRAGLEAGIEAVAKQNAELADALQAQANMLKSSGIRFYALDLGPEAVASQSITDVSIQKQTLESAPSFDVYVQANVTKLEEMTTVVKPVAHRRLQLEAGATEEVRYLVEVRATDGQTRTLAVAQYLMLRGNDSYVITCSTLDAYKDKYASVFLSIAQNFRFLEQ